MERQRERQLVSLAIGPCGCGYGIECENGETGQATVARWKSEGATVERVPIEEAKERCVLDCPHEPRYGLLPLSEARGTCHACEERPIRDSGDPVSWLEGMAGSLMYCETCAIDCDVGDWDASNSNPVEPGAARVNCWSDPGTVAGAAVLARLRNAKVGADGQNPGKYEICFLDPDGGCERSVGGFDSVKEASDTVDLVIAETVIEEALQAMDERGM